MLLLQTRWSCVTLSFQFLDSNKNFKHNVFTAISLKAFSHNLTEIVGPFETCQDEALR